MKAVFLGHQSWLINYNQTNILIDPVLYDKFGNIDDNSIEIYPARSVDIESMPIISAIILSHEHSDHFHIPTLRQFPNVPILVSPLKGFNKTFIV
jgi:L-ascorbate metabolism protein UlaG (beta-lactamase superfamily)